MKKKKVPTAELAFHFLNIYCSYLLISFLRFLSFGFCAILSLSFQSMHGLSLSLDLLLDLLILSYFSEFPEMLSNHVSGTDLKGL
jgi:hypothetical protein